MLMSVKNKKNHYNGKFPILTGSEDYFPKDKFIQFNFNSLSPKRRNLALGQINIYLKKIKLFLLKRELYLEKIKDLIINEQKEFI